MQPTNDWENRKWRNALPHRKFNTSRYQEEVRPRLTLGSCIQPTNISQNILSNYGGIFSIAPAQNNVQLSFFKIPSFEAMPFPMQFPTGQKTLDECRQVRLSPSMYFNTRMFFVNARFVADRTYLFFAQLEHLANGSMSIQMQAKLLPEMDVISTTACSKTKWR